MVGMGGAAAGLTRGPLTGMLMIYELSGNYAVILPLMVTCTIASALCHHLVERKTPRIPKDRDVLQQTAVGSLIILASPIDAATPFRTVLERLSAAEETVLPVCDEAGRIYGIAEFDRFREVWRDERLIDMLVASDVARRTPVVTAEMDLESALKIMNDEDLDALPVVAAEGEAEATGVLTRRSIRQYLTREQAKSHRYGTVPMAPTEL
jgi:CIC family chloride channel protein